MGKLCVTNGGEMGCGEWFKNRVAMAFHLPVETASECKHEEHGDSHVTQEKGGSRCGVPGEAAWRAPAAERKQLQTFTGEEGARERERWKMRHF